jgi:hypothetical protein
MKSSLILTLYILLIFASACKKTETQNLATTNNIIDTTKTVSIDKEKLQTYQNFLNKLDTADLLSASKAGTEFLQIFKDTDLDTNDSAFTLFQDFHTQMTAPIQTIVDKENENYLELFLDRGKVSKAVKEFSEKIKTNGFRLGTVEGYVYVAVLPSFQRKYFFDKLSPAMQSYFVAWEKEGQEGTADDGGLLVEPIILAERLVFWENFAKTYPNFRRKQEVIFQKQGLIDMLLNGLPNTPAFLYDTNDLEKSYRVAYRFLIDKNADTEAGKLFIEYYNILSKNNLKDSPKAQEFRTKITGYAE